MKFNQLKETAVRGFNKSLLQVKKYSPEILLVTGVVGVTVGTVMACKATLKSAQLLDECNTKIDHINKNVEEHPGEFTETDQAIATNTVYKEAVIGVVKAFAPAVIIGVSSVACLVSSNNIMKKRNAALSASLMTLDASFRGYRERVKAKVGEETEKELYYGIKKETVTELDENGNEVTKEVTTSEAVLAPYAKVYNSENPNWSKDPYRNIQVLRGQQNYASDKLRAKGYLFLNDVYEMLGFERTPYGQLVGWVYNENNPVGDNYVDFGMYNCMDEDGKPSLNAENPDIYLDFNVDGDIIDRM